MNHTRFDYDVAIIGGGSGGYAAARVASNSGLRVVVVEGGSEVGGLCILRGCMPTKALLYAADVAHLVRQAGTWGVQAKDIHLDFQATMARKNRLIQGFAAYRTEQLTAGRFNFLRAIARFRDEHTLELSTGGILTSRHFIISTGSRVALPPTLYLKETGYITSDEALALSKPPRSLIVLGGGPVAVEFAQFFARFGVHVTLVQRSKCLLGDCDAGAAEVIETVFQREGMRVFTNTMLTGAKKLHSLKEVRFDHAGRPTTVEAEEIFFALGRIPNTVDLDLEKASVMTEYGRIVTDEKMQTSAPHIYAAGDCTGPYEIVHIAVQQGEVAAHNISHPSRPRTMDYRLLIYAVFTDPQVATIGLTEKVAKVKGIPYLSASYPFNDHGKSMIMEALDGFVKLLADPESGEILGGCCVGPMGGELIHEIVAAMQKRMTVHELSAMPHYHPTLAEIWTYPAEELAEKISVKG